jgi:23S rRNA pseudouridine1911/1915/1917 synthase
LAVVHLDNHLLAVDKPSGMPSQPDPSGDPALPDLARAWLKSEFNKPGKVYLAPLHRLDRPVSGVALLARTDKAAGRMARLFRERRVEKRYLALCECVGEPEAAAALEGVLTPGPAGGMRAGGRAGQPGARRARLSYATLGRSGNGRFALLLVRLETGVKHQIRAQLAAAGLPVAGDFRYGPFGRPARPEAVAGGRAILLHAAQLRFEHPVGKGETRIGAPPPEHWRKHLDLVSCPPGRLPGLIAKTP